MPYDVRGLQQTFKREHILRNFLTTYALFAVTALAEIIGCYLPYLWIRQGRSSLLLIPAALSLAIFAWLLTLHPTAAGRTYAAYGGVYVAIAVSWLWLVEDIQPSVYDIAGVSVILLGVAIMVLAPR